jgi:hypothetical protein
MGLHGLLQGQLYIFTYSGRTEAGIRLRAPPHALHSLGVRTHHAVTTAVFEENANLFGSPCEGSIFPRHRTATGTLLRTEYE